MQEQTINLILWSRKNYYFLDQLTKKCPWNVFKLVLRVSVCVFLMPFAHDYCSIIVLHVLITTASKVWL